MTSSANFPFIFWKDLQKLKVTCTYYEINFPLNLNRTSVDLINANPQVQKKKTKCAIKMSYFNQSILFDEFKK